MKAYVSRNSVAYVGGVKQGAGFKIKELEFESYRGGSSSGEEDVEFGVLKHPARAKAGAVYSVSVVVAEEGRAFGGEGIKATTVVTQKVTGGRGYGRR